MRATLLAISFLLAACGAAEQAPVGSSSDKAAESAETAVASTDIDSAELKKRMDAGPITVVDVRTVGEYQSGHVPGALHIPLSDLESKLSELASFKNQDVYVICAVGGRSASAKRVLTKSGFSKAINVVDGTNGWRAAGYPLE